MQGGVMMDLSKAFDTINHELFIAKLHAYGFSRNALKIVHSYLSDRWHRTKIDGSYSSWKEILSGVPQGSVNGPKWFKMVHFESKCDQIALIKNCAVDFSQIPGVWPVFFCDRLL